MSKLFSALQKEFRLLIRDRIGLALMFLMPVVLVVVITSVQNSTFEMVNDNKINFLVLNTDTGKISKDFISGIIKLGMFDVTETKNNKGADVSELMKNNDALVALVLPQNFSLQLRQKAKQATSTALLDFGIAGDSSRFSKTIQSPDLVFHPVLQKSYRYSINGALQSVMQVTENKLMIEEIYKTINEKEMPQGFETKLMENKIVFNEKFATVNGNKSIPNATQHNIPAWTVFAMFFIVISLGSNMVKEKLSGSFIRLRTLPTSYMLNLIAKQMMYLCVIVLQVIVIFGIGAFLFPKINLPALNIPSDFFALIFVTVICGWCAISYALCIGVFANTQEQANGFGAVSVVLFAAIGGVFVPAFAMPQSFKFIMNLSPLHWCIESYYDLFLTGGTFKNILRNVLPLLASTLIFQLLIFTGLKQKNLI